MPAKKDRTGETVYQSCCGMNATIVTYVNSKNITIKFENGKTKEHVDYWNFIKGKVQSTTLFERTDIDRAERLGQKLSTPYGECEIIEYNNASDITVRFDGDNDTIVSKRAYSDFISGSIKNPKINCNASKRSNRLFSRKLMNCGFWAVVIRYDKVDDIDVRFEIDNQVVRGRHWQEFADGSIAHPTKAPIRDGSVRVGEIVKNRAGELVKLVAYRSAMDIDVLFIDQQILVKNFRYDRFSNGDIPNPNQRLKSSISLQEYAIQYYLNKLGFRKIEQGEWEDRGFGKREIDFYNADVNVAIEYDGGVHRHKNGPQRDIEKNLKCKELGVILYRLRDPYLPLLDDSNSIDFILDRHKEIVDGIIDCKYELEEILNLHGIRFDPSFIDFERDKDQIIREYEEICVDFYRKIRIGERRYNEHAEQHMIIIGYHGYRNIDVEFELDKVTRCGVSYGQFKSGNICHPEKTQQALAQQRLGELGVNSRGLEMQIVAYRRATDIDVVFTLDGARRSGVTYKSFTNRQISHPNDMRKSNT